MESANKTSDLKFEIIHTIEEFLSLRSSWDSIFNENHNTNFYLSYDWFYFLLCINKKVPQDLYIILARSGAEIVAIIPCYINQRRAFFFQHKTLEIIGNKYSPYRGCLLKRDQEREVANGFINFMLIDGKMDWEVISLEDISNLDPFIVELRSALHEYDLQTSREDTFDNIICDLSSYSTSDSYFKSFKKSFREPIKRHINQMNQKGGFNILLPLSSNTDIERLMDDYYDIHARSWKKEDSDPLFHRQLVKHLFENGFLRLFILYMNQESSKMGSDGSDVFFSSYQSSIVPDCAIPSRAIPVAVNYFIVCGNYSYFFKTLYRADYAKYGPGITLMWYSFKYLLEAEHIKIIDYEKGPEDYKFKFGGHNHEKRFRLLIGNPKSLLSRIDLLCRYHLYPPLRRIKRRVLHLLRNRIYKGYTYGVPLDDE